MLTNKDYCDYDTCIALKELGYNYVSDYYYESIGQMIVNRPTITLWNAQKWLRKEKGVIVGLHNNFTTREFKYYISTWEEDICTGNKYTDYEDALSDGIKEAVRLILEGKLCLD